MTLDDIRSLFERAVRALMPNAHTGDDNPLMQFGAAVSAIAANLYYELDLIRRDSVPSTATLQGAVTWGAALDIPRKGPTQAYGNAALQVRGTTGKTIVHGTELRAQASRAVVRVQGHHVIGADGLALVDVLTDDRGRAANLAAGALLRFATVPSGVQELAVLLESLQGGADEEPGGSYQERVARRLAEPPQGGNLGDYRRWIEESLPDALVTGYPLATRSGRGTVDLVGLRLARGTDRLLTQAERDAVLAHVLPRKPATDQVRVIEAKARIVDIDIAVVPVSEPRWQFDFDDQGGIPIESWDPAARLLTLAADLPAGIAPNKRISLRMADGGARGNAGAEQTIAAVVGTRSLAIIEHPDHPISADLGAGDVAFAGGPLVERARRAILDGYTVGCDAGAAHIPGLDQLGPANPATRFGAWLDRIEPSRVEAAARAQAGVDDARCIDPAATVVPFDAASQTGPPPPAVTLATEVLIPGQVIVRRAS